MDTLFELLNLSAQCESGDIGVPRYHTDRDWCSTWSIAPLKNNTCPYLKGCIDNTIIFPYISSPLSSLNMTIGWDGITIDIDQTRLDTNVNSTWLAPILTIGNQPLNLSSLLLASNIYWRLSDQLQRREGRPAYTIDNKRTLQIWDIDGMRHFFDSDALSPTYQSWVVWLPLDFVTTPLGSPSEYPYNYRSSDGLTPYNPRRYVLTRYTTFAVDWVTRNCGRAVRAEPQCCMQTLVLDWCMLWLWWWDACNGRCQTIRDQINWTERVAVCNVFKQQISYLPNQICISQPGILPDQCVDISETNNHYLLTYPGSDVRNYILELYNSNGVLQSSIDLSFMFNQQLVYNTIAVTPQPAHPVPATINNTVCITQPWILPDQCVDLNTVNNQVMYLNGTSLIINSQLDPMNDCDLECDWRILDMTEYFSQRQCSEVCECIMDSVPDWSTLIAEPPTGRPAWWAAFLATNPNVYQMMDWIVTHLVENVENELWPNFWTTTWYERPCTLYNDAPDPVPPTCEACCLPNCGNTNIEINTSVCINCHNITNVLDDMKHNGKRWLTTDREAVQPFNWSIDLDWDICNPLNNNLWWFPVGNAFDWAYGWNPSAMANSQMTDPFDAISWVKCLQDWSYTVYMDWPIQVNHMVHAFRIAMILIRDIWTANEQRIIIEDWKMSGDPVSASGSVNNWYFKETKQYYVSTNKVVEMLRWDIITLQVKIDANVSRPRDDIDPITLWVPWDDDTLWSTQSSPSCSATEDDLIFRCTNWPWEDIVPAWGVQNQWVWIEYGWPSTSAYAQNFNWLVPTGTPPDPALPNTRVYYWLNGFVRTSEKYLTLDHNCNCSGGEWWCSVSCSSHNASHSHTIINRMPAIAPQAPKYIHFTDAVTANWNYPGRYTDASLNPHNQHSIPYSNVGIDANGVVRLLAKAGLDESGCDTTSGYNYISEQSGFSFGFNLVRSARPQQIEIYP